MGSLPSISTAVLQFAVDFAAMPNVFNDDSSGHRINPINDSVIADPETIELFCSFQFERLFGKRIIRQVIYCAENARDSGPWQKSKILLGGRLVKDLK